MRRIIAYSGTHGTGKTTSVFEMAHRLKIDHPDKTVGIVAEVASRCPYPINRSTTTKSQMWIFAAQIAEELERLRMYDLVVSDRTGADCIAYTMVSGRHYLAEGMVAVLAHHTENYQKIFFKTAAMNPHCHDDGVREHVDNRFRLRVEMELIKVYQRLGLYGSDRFVEV